MAPTVCSLDISPYLMVGAGLLRTKSFVLDTFHTTHILYSKRLYDLPGFMSPQCDQDPIICPLPVTLER